jgi:ISXO2-like transposase domain/Transposase zinc-ribbon domain
VDVSEFPSSETEFRTRFAFDNQCREYLARRKWPEGFRCAHCIGRTAYFLPSKRVVYECAGCRRQVSVIAGTIFEQSKKSLALWFRAIFEVTASKQGISAAELQRKLGLGSYQTAWSWLHKIRSAMVPPPSMWCRCRPDRQPLSGEIEIDESYLGGPEAGKPGRAAEKKAIVAAAVEKRGQGCGRVRLGPIADVSAGALRAFVEKHLGSGETAHTDGWRGYSALGKTGYRHIVWVLFKLDQTAAAVLPRVHLLFSLLKRWILGTHQGSVSRKQLDGYLESLPSGSTAAAPDGLHTAPSDSSVSPW